MNLRNVCQTVGLLRLFRLCAIMESEEPLLES